MTLSKNLIGMNCNGMNNTEVYITNNTTLCTLLATPETAWGC